MTQIGISRGERRKERGEGSSSRSSVKGVYLIIHKKKVSKAR